MVGSYSLSATKSNRSKTGNFTPQLQVLMMASSTYMWMLLQFFNAKQTLAFATVIVF